MAPQITSLDQLAQRLAATEILLPLLIRPDTVRGIEVAHGGRLWTQGNIAWRGRSAPEIELLRISIADLEMLAHGAARAACAVTPYGPGEVFDGSFGGVRVVAADVTPTWGTSRLMFVVLMRSGSALGKSLQRIIRSIRKEVDPRQLGLPLGDVSKGEG